MEDIKVKALKKYWVVVDDKGKPDETTISSTKVISTRMFLFEWDDVNPEWKDCEKQGYRCIKVNIEFKPTK